MSNGYGRFSAQVRRARHAPLTELVELFGPWVELPDRFGDHVRERLFSPARTFWLFLSQVLAADRSCREVVRKYLAWLALEQGKTASPNTGGYCRARGRLSVRGLKQLHPRVVERIESTGPRQWRWYGRRVKVIDGSSVSMPDTAQNQQAYPQPEGQKPGCGFPVMRIVAIFSLVSHHV